MTNQIRKPIPIHILRLAVAERQAGLASRPPKSEALPIHPRGSIESGGGKDGHGDLAPASYVNRVLIAVRPDIDPNGKGDGGEQPAPNADPDGNATPRRGVRAEKNQTVIPSSDLILRIVWIDEEIGFHVSPFPGIQTEALRPENHPLGGNDLFLLPADVTYRSPMACVSGLVAGHPEGAGAIQNTRLDLPKIYPQGSAHRQGLSRAGQSQDAQNSPWRALPPPVPLDKNNHKR